MSTLASHRTRRSLKAHPCARVRSHHVGARQRDPGRALRLNPNIGAGAALVPERLSSGIPARVDDVTAGFFVTLERKQAPRGCLFQEGVE